jgi:hypothetical protein
MVDRIEKLAPEEVAKLAERVFGQPVERVTAPGGSSRDSLRVHMADRTVIATQRKYPGRARMEITVLKALSAEGAPVPRYLGGEGHVFFQEDSGSRRLSAELLRQSGAAQDRVAARAFEGLVRVQEAGRRAGLAARVPALGTGRDWIDGFVATPIAASPDFGIAAPQIDRSALADALTVEADTFLKWDARPGNGAIGADGTVLWFDWEHCGRRQGMEDFAWLAGDEFWPIGPERVIAVLSPLLPAARRAADLRWLGLYVTFHIVQRIVLIRKRYDKAGWVDPAKAMRYDKIGTDSALALRLCRHGAGWADRDPATRPMVRWFEDCSRAIEALPEKTAG